MTLGKNVCLSSLKTGQHFSQPLWSRGNFGNQTLFMRGRREEQKGRGRKRVKMAVVLETKDGDKDDIKMIFL